ncbi:MAG: hypothetical protein IKM20_10545 [Erysipelotrichales bacterium]|nr:hypothetical protein [Erysipelotrichales bacterium]
MRKQLIILLSLLLLSGCSMQGNTNGTSTSNTSNTSNTTSTTVAPGSISSIWGMMDYMGNRGLTYSGVNEIGDLNEGYNQGLAFQHNGGDYQLYHYDTKNETMKEVVNSIKETNKVQLQVNGEYVELPAYAYEDYILIYPEGIETSEIEGYFR